MITEKLEQQQQLIIDSSESKIVVMAGPGSGKTYTMVRKAKKELGSLDGTSKGIILCSFTREAASNLKKKFDDNELKYSFCGTLDSFILSEIFSTFKNRIYKSLNVNRLYEEPLVVSFPGSSKEMNELAKRKYDKNDKLLMQSIREWRDKFYMNHYEISFQSYAFGAKIINVCDLVKEYISSRYATIYIDEAQDLNSCQHLFIKNLISCCNLNCIMIGDHRQCIYRFRGSYPDDFVKLAKTGYTRYEITESARCHESIFKFAKMIAKEDVDITKVKENRVKIINDINVFYDCMIKSDDFYCLVSTNSERDMVKDKLNNKGFDKVEISNPIKISDSDFYNTYITQLEEILFFYYNYNNKDKELCYSSLDLFNVLLPVDNKHFSLSYRDLAKHGDETVSNYTKRIFKTFLSYDIPNSIMDEIREQLECGNSITKSYYIRDNSINRIMTIHSSKGLERNDVFVLIKRKGLAIDEDLQSTMFVAFTRAKENLRICFYDSCFGEDPLEKRIKDYINMM